MEVVLKLLSMSRKMAQKLVEIDEKIRTLKDEAVKEDQKNTELYKGVATVYGPYYSGKITAYNDVFTILEDEKW